MTKEESIMNSMNLKSEDLPFNVNEETGEVTEKKSSDKLSEKITKANKNIKVTRLSRNSKNKETGKVTKVTKGYAEVPQRVKAFREVYPAGSITTEIIVVSEKSVTMKATVRDEQGTVIATGHASENTEKNAQINATSMLENCETSCVGRALGFAGFGISDSIASYEEVTQAVEQQNKIASQQKGSASSITPKQKAWIESHVDAAELNNRLFKLGKSSLDQLTSLEASNIIGGK